MKELYEKYMNKRARILAGGLGVQVKIVDVKMSWGRERFRVIPVAGDGAVWVESVQLLIKTNWHDKTNQRTSE